jgi:deoxyribonuclease-1
MKKVRKTATIVSLLVLFCINVYGSQNTSITSFNKAKKILKKKIYKDNKFKKAFYSNCSYSWEKYTFESGKTRWKEVVNKESCGYIPRTKSNRANFIEYEHIVPAHAFGHSLPCWKEGGRKNCRKVSNKFRLMESDIMNLVPAIGELNADRSNYTFTILEGEPRKYGSVDFEVDFKKRKVEPREEIRGQIARTYLYFAKNYGLKISKKQKQLFKSWNNMYPMTDLERSKKMCLLR